MIKTSIRKRRLTNSFAYNDNNAIINNIDLNDTNKNNKTIIINRRNDFNKYKEYKNQCNIYLNNNNEEQNNNFSKTSAILFKNNQKINEDLKEKLKNIKDSTINKKEKYFYNDYKTLENFFNDKNKTKDVNIKRKENTIDSSPIIFHKNTPIYLNKVNIKRK